MIPTMRKHITSLKKELDKVDQALASLAKTPSEVGAAQMLVQLDKIKSQLTRGYHRLVKTAN